MEQWEIGCILKKRYEEKKTCVMKKYSLTSAEVDVLSILDKFTSIKTSADIVKVSQLQKSHVSLAINSFINKNLLKKEKRRYKTLNSFVPFIFKKINPSDFLIWTKLKLKYYFQHNILIANQVLCDTLLILYIFLVMDDLCIFLQVFLSLLVFQLL